MAEQTIISIEVNQADGSVIYVNPAHIVKLVKTGAGNHFVYLTNGEMFPVTYGDAQKVREYFENSQRRFF